MQDQIDFLYRAGAVRRFHTIPIINHQSIADHSWHVTMLAHILYGQEPPGMSAMFLLACMTHDMAESVVGDVPAPAKRGMSEKLGTDNFRAKWGEVEQEILSHYSFDFEKFLSEEEKRRLKLVDALEGSLYCVKERMLGNKSIRICYKNFINYVGELLEDVGDVPFNHEPLGVPQREWDAFNHVQMSWELANV